MKRKLLKYELMATARLYLPLYLVMAGFSVLGRLSLWRLPWQVTTTEDLAGWTNLSITVDVEGGGLKGQFLGSLITLVMVLYVLVVLGALVVHFIITLQRFWKNLMGDEGYLMFTLPVSTGDLLWAKAASVFLWGFATVLMVILSVLILVWHPQLTAAIRQGLAELGPDVWATAGQMARLIFPPVAWALFLAELVVNGFSGTFQLYAAMAMGHTVKRHKVLASLVSYGAIATVVGVAASLLMGLLLPGFAAKMDQMELFMSTPELLLIAQAAGEFFTATWAFVLVIDLAAATGCFLLARHLLNTQLNLE